VKGTTMSLHNRIFLGVAAAALFVGSFDAPAHEAPLGWNYPLSCCSSYDCKQVSAGVVKESPQGYVIDTGEVVAYSDKRVRQSPDGEFHWCAHQAGVDAGRTICLFVPTRGF